MKRILTILISITLALAFTSCATTREEVKAHEQSFRPTDSKVKFRIDETIRQGELKSLIDTGYTHARKGTYTPYLEDDKGTYFVTMEKNLFTGEKPYIRGIFVSHDWTYTEPFTVLPHTGIWEMTGVIPEAGTPSPHIGTPYNIIDKLVILADPENETKSNQAR